jgi:oxygen-dependent protoporphyrinogen oxidase
MTAGPQPRPPSGRGTADSGEPGPRTPVVAIIGGGIAGLAAAYALRDAGVAVTVLEGSPRLGGKLAVSPVAGIDVDAGAEALLARRPVGVGLLAELGLDGERREPGTTSAGIWTRGEVRPLPRRQFMGVPADPAELAATGLLSPEGLARAAADAELPAAPADDADASVTDRVGGRMGREVVDRLVEPLLGGVYAGRCEDLSFQATLAPLAAAAPRFASLGQAVASLLPPPPAASASAAPPPVFTTLAGGLGTLPPLLAAASGAEVRTESTVR